MAHIGITNLIFGQRLNQLIFHEYLVDKLNLELNRIMALNLPVGPLLCVDRTYLQGFFTSSSSWGIFCMLYL